MSVAIAAYERNFPAQVPYKAAQSFAATAALCIFVGRNGREALIGGALAATATLVNAIVRPIFRTLFPTERGSFSRGCLDFVSHSVSLLLTDEVATRSGLSFTGNSFLMRVLAGMIALDLSKEHEANVYIF